MTLPSPPEHEAGPGAQPRVHPAVDSVDAERISHAPYKIAGAARQAAKAVGRWLMAEAGGTGPVRTRLGRVASGYRTAQSQLIEPLPPALEAALRHTIGSDETILVKLKGGFKEALVCTDLKIYIIKKGFLTGNTIGANVFLIPLANLGSIDVKFGSASWQGRFELLPLGASTSVRRQSDAISANNCVTLYGPLQAQRFRNACSFILKERQKALSPSLAATGHEPQLADNPIASLGKLSDLYDKGLLTREEFDSQKQVLLSRN